MVAHLNKRFEEALVFSTRLHATQLRKGTQTPYISHLLSVAALVLEAGGDEDLAIAALLHDAVEDQGGLETLALIQEQYGDRVAFIVKSCSDAYTQPKPPWKIRKREYLAHLRLSTPDVRLVSLADKLHNSRCILKDILIGDEKIWEKFNGGKEGTLWYYRSLIDVFEKFERNFLLDELTRVVNQIESLANSK
jgi:(p)ppGpp synthase/HD superfamily hydrolase